MITSLLIANQGEIACRIIRTARASIPPLRYAGEECHRTRQTRSVYFA
ncbi:biotin carboxylase N-terminal domain-containing protein [Sphingomonas sp. SUN039]